MVNLLPVCYRKEVLALGLTVLVDVRSSSFPPLLTHTLCYLQVHTHTHKDTDINTFIYTHSHHPHNYPLPFQKNMAGFIHSVLLLANRDDLDMDRPPASQVLHTHRLPLHITRSDFCLLSHSLLYHVN